MFSLFVIQRLNSTMADDNINIILNNVVFSLELEIN